MVADSRKQLQMVANCLTRSQMVANGRKRWQIVANDRILSQMVAIYNLFLATRYICPKLLLLQLQVPLVIIITINFITSYHNFDHLDGRRLHQWLYLLAFFFPMRAPCDHLRNEMQTTFGAVVNPNVK